jgi:hypothetical protein
MARFVMESTATGLGHFRDVVLAQGLAIVAAYGLAQQLPRRTLSP